MNAPLPFTPLGPYLYDLHIPKHLFSEPLTDPAAYALIIRGQCLEPEACHDDMAICSPAVELKPGGFVLISMMRRWSPA